MTRYHLNLDGNPGRCTAKEGNCPFGSNDEHYDSKHEARKAYERQHEPVLTAFEVMQKHFSTNYAVGFKKYAEAIDARKPDFLEHASGDTVYGVLSIARRLNKEQQMFIDENVRSWLKKKKSEVWSSVEGDREDEEANERWREAKMHIRNAFEADHMEPKIKSSKAAMAFIERDAQNYSALATAIMANDLTTDRRGIFGYHVTRHGLYQLDLPKTYSLEGYRKVGEINPQGITLAMKKYYPHQATNHAKEMYEIVAKGEEDYSADWQENRREAIKTVLQHTDITQDADIFLDASTKINKANGLSTKELARIVNAELKKHKNSVELGGNNREKIQKIVKNIRDSKEL